MKVVERVTCKFGRNDVRVLKFTKTDKRVRVSCKGLPALTIRPCKTDHKGFEASVRRENCIEFVTARTPEAAFKKGVRRLWK